MPPETSTTLARTPAETTTPPKQPTGTATGTGAEALCTAADLAGSHDSTGGGAEAQLRYTQAGNYRDCKQMKATGFRVYPSGATDSLYINRPTTACRNTDIKLLAIGAFQP